jgi:cupin-like protein
MLTLKRSEVTESHLSGNEPVLIMDGLSDWPAISRWSPKTLGDLAPDALVDLMVTMNGSFRFNPDYSPVDPSNQLFVRNQPFKRAVQEIVSKEPSTTKYYITQASIPRRIPALLSDIKCWWPVETSALNLWFGSSGVITTLHFDKSPNLFAQIHGTKRFTLFHPDQSKYLYPYPGDSDAPHLSFVDVEKPDFTKYPDYSMAVPESFDIQPGQMMFLPPLWWHHVESVTMSISVNQWLQVPSVASA